MAAAALLQLSPAGPTAGGPGSLVPSRRDPGRPGSLSDWATATGTATPARRGGDDLNVTELSSTSDSFVSRGPGLRLTRAGPGARL